MVIYWIHLTKDIEKKILRTPLDPDITYSDDPLRMMRAIRFANQLNFEIEEEFVQSITKTQTVLKSFQAHC
jgi:tRNA nucleotidyltransferase (CCA-adding enzyme)